MDYYLAPAHTTPSKRDTGSTGSHGKDGEVPSPCKPRSLASLHLRCAVAGIAFIVPASVILSLGLLLFWLVAIPAWLLAEGVFGVWFVVKCLHYNRQPQPHHPGTTIDEGLAIWSRFIEGQEAMSKYICIKEMLSRWFYGRPLSQLTRGNIVDLLCYGFFFSTPEALEAQAPGLPDRLVTDLERAWFDGVAFPTGRYRPLPFMQHLWQPVRCFYRPLAFYAGVEFLMLLKHCMLTVAGFQVHYQNGLCYYTYGLAQPGSAAAPATDEASVPFLFLHGVGLGILPYLLMVLQLAATGRPVVAVEVRHLSMRLCNRVPEEDEVVQDIMAALAKHAVPSIHVVAHSYGTFMASRIIQLHRGKVASLALLDPVCFLMYHGKLIYNFVYRSPLGGGHFLTWFIARDMAHAVSVSRRFYWTLLNLWPDQLPANTLVVLSAHDELVPIKEVTAMLQHNGNARLLFHPTHCHADFIMDLPWQRTVLQHILDMVAQGAQQQQQQLHCRSDSASSYEANAEEAAVGPKRHRTGRRAQAA